MNSSKELELPTAEPSFTQENESYAKATAGPGENLED